MNHRAQKNPEALHLWPTQQEERSTMSYVFINNLNKEEGDIFDPFREKRVVPWDSLDCIGLINYSLRSGLRV